MKTEKTIKKELRLVENLIKKDFVKEKTISELYDHVLKSKGKKSGSNREWKSRLKPIIPNDVPLAVLIDKNSASASEIVSGALQDLDRAVIIGQKSFGKGLIQHPYDINDTLTMKITTAKYYLPSGRLIQVEDYFKKGFLESGIENDTLFKAY